MSGVVIPLGTDPLFDQVTALEGVDYVLRFAFNERDQYWYLDLLDQDGDPIATSLRCVVGWPLLRRSTDGRKPPGILAFEDASGLGRDPGFEDLGTRVQLVYFTKAEVDAARS